MRKLLIIALLFVIGCKCPQLAVRSNSDSTYVVSRVDTVFLPGKVIEKQINLSYLCDSIYKQGADVSLEDLFSDSEPATAKVKTGKLIVRTPCPPSSIVHDTTFVNNTKTETVTVIQQAPPTWWDKLYEYGFWILLAIVATALGMKIKSLYV